jgi:hypothetical protein
MNEYFTSAHILTQRLLLSTCITCINRSYVPKLIRICEDLNFLRQMHFALNLVFRDVGCVGASGPLGKGPETDSEMKADPRPVFREPEVGLDSLEALYWKDGSLDNRGI